ncbi:deoxyribodipyrimidine photolyase-related protein [Pedobacter cryoconitis]|uniref:Deoxyribodipyrimidine photolyase-related protein n=1 Tax=Pedobacter cryoconitis TaxID=188932 RepID=A0A7W9DYY3_9SPHI|nr:cryptochrome/photolyase family protein [Pedobacter cryoconitis]MBB5635005.1 deoxyribodipyrimidine photolyase-related protein [Pedobacter cryoconitis]
MLNSVTLIFPHQLFQNHPALQKDREIYLVEEWLFFKQYNFHRQKLVLHRASMKFYEGWLQQNGYTANYIETCVKENDCRILVASLAKQNIGHIHISAVADNWLMQRMQSACSINQVKLHVYDSPNFLNTTQDTANYFSKRKTYFQTDFYIWQRKKNHILLEQDEEPTGGKWSFDEDNRKKFPKKEKVPLLELPKENNYVTEAKVYVQKHFPNNYGEINTRCLFVVTFQDALNWLDNFLKNRFEKFGIYEDAIVAKESVLHHSVLTPMLNIGLLQPGQIITAALAAAKKYNTPLNSLEGFVRQIMGWREFVHLVYERESVKQRNTNYWKFKRKIPKSFWTGETGISPIDITIKKILQTGYCHHIERLMVLGNFMQLCEFDPDEVYRWFMEMFIDAYDWVMVPNVYGMTQFADGGLMVTKPYISGSNYLMKMSDYEKGEWQSVWDGLFWRFMHVHRNFFLKNPRLGMLVNMFDKMAAEKQHLHLTNAEKFLEQLDDKISS